MDVFLKRGMENLGLPERIQTILNVMLRNQATRSHMILIGPPGSGKTTSAKYFVEALHGKKGSSSFFGRALFLNSSDERGLEAVRSRVYPFIRSSFQALFPDNSSPKVIIFDEAETLTDQAQIALRPLLDESPEKILIIFLCNSISRIHKSILHKFLIIPFEAPKTVDFNHRMNLILNQSSSKISGLDIQFRRGDIRFFILNPKRFDDCARVWTDIFTSHIDGVNDLFERILQKWTFPDVAMFCMFCASSTGCLNRTALLKLLKISDTDFVKMIPMKQRSKLLSGWFVKFVRQNLEGSLTAT